MSQTTGERLYKTGDLARYLPDGNIEFLGRLDHQVKIRGFRIELGEIEVALAAHPAVREAVVLTRGEGAQRQLVAYVVAHELAADIGVTPPNAAELRNALKASLPDYMVPSAWVFLPALPLTPNGKVDRKALPEPVFDDRVAGAYVGPRDPIELRLALLWEEVLGRQSIGVNEDFFDLGGQSLLAVRLMARIEQAWGVHLPLASLFEYPTIERLAARLRQRPVSSPSSGLVPIQPTGSRPPFFMVPGAGGNVLYLVRTGTPIGTRPTVLRFAGHRP